MSLQSSLFIATDRRSKKLGIPSLEAPRIPLWQSKRSGVFLFLKSQPLINSSSNHSPSLMIRMVLRPIIAWPVVGSVFSWCWLGLDSSTRLIGEGTDGISGWGIGEERYTAWVIWELFIIFQKWLTGFGLCWPGCKGGFGLRVFGGGFVITWA